MASTKGRMTAKRRDDAETVLIWKAALALMDRRTLWPRALMRAIQMIEERDPRIVKDQADLRRMGKAMIAGAHSSPIGTEKP